MALTREWTGRVRNWMTELPRHFYAPLGVVDFEGFVTAERLEPEEAARGDFSPMPAGTKWGAKWEYAWFRAAITLPEEARGRRIVLAANPGAEGLVFVNGVAAGARDREHREITLCAGPDSLPGRKFGILAEFYAGHGLTEESVGPVPPGRIPMPEPGPAQQTVGESSFGIWNDEAFALWIDAQTLLQTRDSLSESSLRVSQIDGGLRDFTRIVDFETSAEAREASFVAARARLAPLLACVNGSTAPTMYIFGQSHLDLAWKWPRQETVRKSARTMSTQLALMDEYPEYRYLFCQVPLFLMLKEHYPEIWERTRRRLIEGRAMAEGGMWLEPDTNLPSGEALIRQILFAKRFFREELGSDTSILWLPDTFGFSAALPQIMKGCGLSWFATKKIADTYSDGEPFPYSIFMWQGLDGTRVLSHVFRKCNSQIDPATLSRRWNTDRIQKDGISTYLFPFGYGDGGGGPTRTMLEFTRRLGDLEGIPRTRMSHPADFFRDIERHGLPKDVYVGELYFSEHRGTYTSQARTKRANRLAEFALREAEFWASVATGLGSASGAVMAYPRELMERIWQSLLMNHFHDVITGASIRRVHEEAEAELSGVARDARSVRDLALASLEAVLCAEDEPRGGDSCSPEFLRVYNSLSWERAELVPIPKGASAFRVADGEPGGDAGRKALPVQETEAGSLALVDLPPCGWSTIRILPDRERMVPGVCDVEVADSGTGIVMSNGLARIVLDRFGSISSIFDLTQGRELAAGNCNEFRLYKDVTTNYDAWDIDSMYESVPVVLDSPARMIVLDKGPLVARVRIERSIVDSGLTQEIVLRRGSVRVDFRTRIDWRENHRLLKVAFPVAFRADEALSEIQFGHVRRPTHSSRRHDADRYEVSQHKWTAIAEPGRGFALLNDCKYGVSVRDSIIALTLLKAAWVPDMRADRGIQEFTYALYFWNSPLGESGLVREAYNLNSPVLPRPVPDPGDGSRSIFVLDKPSVVLETAKPPEDGSGDIMLRLYECYGTATRCALRTDFALERAFETDMLEQGGRELSISGGAISLDFRAFEIKTVRLVPASGDQAGL